MTPVNGEHHKSKPETDKHSKSDGSQSEDAVNNGSVPKVEPKNELERSQRMLRTNVRKVAINKCDG